MIVIFDWTKWLVGISLYPSAILIGPFMFLFDQELIAEVRKER